MIITIDHRKRLVHISYAVWSYPFPAIFEKGDLKDREMLVFIHCFDYLMRFTQTFLKLRQRIGDRHFLNL